MEQGGQLGNEIKQRLPPGVVPDFEKEEGRISGFAVSKNVDLVSLKSNAEITVERAAHTFAVVRWQFAFAQVFDAFRDHDSLRHRGLC